MRKIVVLLLTAVLFTTGTIFISGGAEAVQTIGSPGNPVATPGVGYIDVSWTPAPGAPSQYYVYWSTVSGSVQVSGYPTVVGGTTSHVTMGGAPDYPSPLPPGYTLYFQICADYGSSGYRYSGWSGAVTTVNYPGVPGSVQAQVSGDDITISWTAPSSNGGGSISSYKIYRGTVSGTLSEIGSALGNELEYLDDSVAGGQTYYYAVAAFNGYNGALSPETSITLPAGRPGATTNLQCAPGVGNITLTWNAPALDGGSPVIDYRIYRSTASDEGALIGSTGGTNRSYVDHGVTIGQTYYYQVTAVNSVGESGRGSEVTISYVAPPSSPQNLQAVAAPGEIKLAWDAPASNGGSSIVWYDIYRNNLTAGNGWEWYSYTEGALHFNDSGVQLGCEYQYEISAWNEGNLEGPRSDLVEVSLALPPAPLNIAASASDRGSLLVSWDPPAAGGITSYVVDWGTSSGTYDWHTAFVLGSISENEGRLTVTLDGLEDNTLYYVTVVAVNSLGNGPAGVPVSATTMALLAPDAPSDLAAEGGHEAIRIDWSAPAEMGSGIQNYLVYRGPSADQLVLIDTIGNVTSYIDDNVVVGTLYYYAVAASNLAGAGPVSEVMVNSTIYAPGVPVNVEANSDIGEVHLAWERPAADGNAPIGYRLYRSTAGGGEVLIAELGSVEHYDDADVVNGTVYRYRVAAFNSQYEGEASSQVTATPYNVPSAPNDLAVERGTRSLIVTWSAPSSDNGAAVLGYQVLVWAPGASSPAVFDAGQANSYLVNGLVNSTAYSVKVLAYNLAGDSPESAAVQATTFALSPAPVVTVTSGNAYVRVAWTAPASDAAITGYSIYRGTSPEVMTPLAATGSERSFNDTSAENGQTYYYAVAALSEVGEGARSDAVPATPSTVPGAPRDLEADPGVGRVSLTWSSPDSDGGVEITGYNVYRGKAADAMTWLAVVFATEYNDADAVSGESYIYRVVAVNANGEGASAELNAAVLFPPPAPSNLTVARTAEGAVIAWEMPDLNSTSSPVTGFAIYRQSVSGEFVLIGVVNGSEARSFADPDAPEGSSVYSVAALNGNAAAAAASMSQSAVLSAGSSSPSAAMAIAVVAVGGFLILLLFRRKKE